MSKNAKLNVVNSFHLSVQQYNTIQLLFFVVCFLIIIIFFSSGLVTVYAKHFSIVFGILFTIDIFYVHPTRFKKKL